MQHNRRSLNKDFHIKPKQKKVEENIDEQSQEIKEKEQLEKDQNTTTTKENEIDQANIVVETTKQMDICHTGAAQKRVINQKVRNVAIKQSSNKV